MLNACIRKGLVDGELRGHDGVVGGGKDGLDARCHESFRCHLDLGGGGAVLLDVLDAVGIAEGLGVGDGLGGGILAQIIQQADGVDVRVDGQDEVHNGVGVQRIGGAGDVGFGVKTGGGGVGDGRVDHRDVGIFHSGQHGGGGGGSHSHDDVHAVGHEVGADLVQVGLVGLSVGVVIAVIKGDTLLLAQLVQTALHRLHDLVQGGVIDVVDNAHFEGLARSGGGAGAGGSRGRSSGGRSGAAGCGTAARQAQCGEDGGGGCGLQEAAAGDQVHGFHSGTPFLGAGGKIINKIKTRSTCGTG